MEPRDEIALERLREKLAMIRFRRDGEKPERGGEVLRERARKLAEEPSPAQEGDVLEVVEFRIGSERLAFEAAWVQEVFTPRAIVKVPCTPPFVAGVVNLRGSILSVVDLSLVLDIPAAAQEAKAALLLSDGKMAFGVLAAEVESARTVFHHEIQSPLTTVAEKTTRFQRGILPGAVCLLDARLLLSSPQMRVERKENAD